MMKKFMKNMMKYGMEFKVKLLNFGLLKLKFAASPIRNDKYILAKLKIFMKKI